MQFAVSHDAVPTDHPAEAHEPSPAKQRRVATTATLLAVAVCAIMAKGHLLEAQTPSHNAAVAQNTGTAPVTIVAPEFCKDQTWPYIDSRCLRRVDNPAPDAPQATVPPATTAAAAPAPSGGSANTVAATPPTAETTVAQTTVATNAPPAARRRTRRTRETRSCSLCFQPPHRTPEPTPPPTPTRAPLMLHNAVGRSIGITNLAFSDFASS